MPTETRDERTIIPLLDETVTVDVRDVEKSKTRINKIVDHCEEIAEAMLRDEEIDVQRVPIGRVVDAAPSIRQEGATLIIPLLSEQLVVEKRLVLKEELHVTRRSTAKPFRQAVTLRSERAEIEREPAVKPTKP